MKQVSIILMAVGLLVLAGCATLTPEPTAPPSPTPTPKPGPITSTDDIIGTWHRITPGDPLYILFLEDGNMHESSNPDLVEDRPMGKSEFWFEGTQRFVEQSLGYCDEYSTGIYEVLLLANGNLKFVVIEDECGFRSTYYSGRGDAEGLIEFEPVP